MYAVRRRDETSGGDADFPIWCTVLGSTMFELLRADEHEYFYIGNSRRAVLNKNGKRVVVNPEYLRFLKLEAADKVQGQRVRDEKFGLLKDDEDYKAMLVKMLEKIDSMYEGELENDNHKRVAAGS